VTKTPASPQYEGVSQSARPPDAGLAAFNEVYEREFEYVWRALGRFGVPHADLDDGVHEVFLVLHRRWNDVDRKDALRPWLFGVARRVAATLRAKRRETPSDVEPIAPEDDPLAAQRDLLWRALATLDDDRRAVVILHDFEGRTGAEIATIVDAPVNTVHSRLRLARADLLAAVRRLGGKQ
jgi:RNA polymerase sigma-70 factor (ECF subfamily)